MAVGTSVYQRSIAETGRNVWLHTRRWDLTFIIASAVLVPVPLILHYWMGVPTYGVDLLVALVVGGPHMYATLTVTYLDKSFMKRYPHYAFGSLVIPAIVVGLALYSLPLLITVFMVWASIHVLHQFAYIADCYRQKGGESLRSWSRLIDYALIFSSLYPFATAKLVTGEFHIAGQYVLVPTFIQSPVFVWLAWAFFLLALVVWIAKTQQEIRAGSVSWPRIALITLACSLALFIPTFDNLDVAFQGMNTWHSFQYLAIIWYVNKLRADRGELMSGLVQRVSGQGRTKRFYLMNMGVTLASVFVMGGIFLLSGLSWDQSYYIVVLGSLLVHYYFDHFLFTRVGTIVR